MLICYSGERKEQYEPMETKTVDDGDGMLDIVSLSVDDVKSISEDETNALTSQVGGAFQPFVLDLPPRTILSCRQGYSAEKDIYQSCSGFQALSSVPT